MSDLAKHNCLVTATEEGLADGWAFRDGTRNLTVKVGGHLHCNDGEVLTRWAIGGHGLAWRSAWEVSEEIDKGRLVEVLPKFAAPGHDIFAVYPDRKFLPAKVRLFIDFMKKTFGDPPYWEAKKK